MQFSNTSCEQLEQKIEELEHNNKQLQKLCNIQQSLLAQKTSALVDTQKDFAQLKCQHEQLLQVKAAVEETNTSYEADQMLNMKSEVENKHLDTNKSSDITELQSSLADLVQNVQNLTLQKQKFESQLEEVMNENQSLVKALERADDEIVDLQTRLRSYEEKTLDLISPKLRSCPFSEIPNFSPCDNIQSPLALQPTDKACKSPQNSSSSQDTGLSLFRELDVQYSTLQQRYCELVEQCTCSASLLHKKWLPSVKPSANSQENSMVTDAPFKELFDEVFASLKQTTLVADKLFTRKNSTK